MLKTAGATIIITTTVKNILDTMGQEKKKRADAPLGRGVDADVLKVAVRALSLNRSLLAPVVQATTKYHKNGQIECES